MTEDQREKLKVWLDNWKEVDKVQTELRKSRIRNSKTADSILALDVAFRSALWRSPKRQSSGLIEFHKILDKSR